MRDGERAARQYDAMAASYTADNDDGVFNSLYERPAMLSMLGDVADRRVLDIGCGAGQLSSELVERGARVTGIDVSPAMVHIAHKRYGDLANFMVADLDEPLPFDSDSFDIVAASLVLHYLEDWRPTLREIRRVLCTGGSLTFSTHHPTMDFGLFTPHDYFAKELITDTWDKGGEPFEVSFWRRPLREISAMLHDAGFVIDLIHEPAPSDELAAAAPSTYDRLCTNPHFLFIRAVPK